MALHNNVLKTSLLHFTHELNVFFSAILDLLFLIDKSRLTLLQLKKFYKSYENYFNIIMEAKYLNMYIKTHYRLHDRKITSQ